MEKENKKLREGRRKEYNHTVRVSNSKHSSCLLPVLTHCTPHWQQLASHVRKLDKRVLLHQKQQREQQKQRVQEAEEQRRQKVCGLPSHPPALLPSPSPPSLPL